VVLTVLEHGEEVSRHAVAEDSRTGLVQLYDGWARTIARHFVRTTRFDPLHQAATEQILYIQLHTHLATLTERRSTEVAISSGGRRYSIELDRRELVDAARQPYEIIHNLVRQHLSDTTTTLLLGDRIAALPGLGNELATTDEVEVVPLHPAAAGSTALNWAESICTKGPNRRLVTTLPGYDAKVPAPMTVAVGAPDGEAAHPAVPTHLVIDGVAHRLTSSPLLLTSPGGDDPPRGRDETGDQLPRVRVDRGRVLIEAPPDASISINDKALDGAAELVIGDRLRVGSREILLVAMKD
jgi:hypothetical protein